MVRVCVLLVFFVVAVPLWPHWTNTVQVDAGYRRDVLHHDGELTGASSSSLDQRIHDITLIQVDIQDTCLWEEIFFFRGMLGYGRCLHAGNTVTHLYSHEENGKQAWNLDFSTGFWVDASNYLSFEPRGGYAYQSIDITKATHTIFRGPYIGISFPIYFCKHWSLIPDVSYLFEGTRDEDITYKGISLQTVDHGHVHGIRGGVSLDYSPSKKWYLGFAWKYSNLKVSAKQQVPLDSSTVLWNPRTMWMTSQYLCNFGYTF